MATGKSAFITVDSVVKSVAVTTTAVPTQFEVAVSDSSDEEEVADSTKLKYARLIVFERLVVNWLFKGWSTQRH